MHGDRTIDLERRSHPTKNGDWVFRREGVKATVYVCPRIFAKGVVPDRITISSPDPVFRRQGPAVNPAKVAARAARLTERATRLAKRADDAAALASHAEACAADARRAAQ